MTPAAASRRQVRLTTVLTVVLAGLWSCGEPSGPPPPNIILISVDTLRADRVGSYGFPKETTPFIDSLAAEGVRFEHAISQSSWTLPSHISLFTSQYVGTHGVVNEKTALAEGAITLTEVLTKYGYHTAAFASWVYLKPEFGFGQGFDEYHLNLYPEQIKLASGHGAFNAKEMVDEVEDWLDRRSRAPFLLFVHLFDPHLDYSPPAPYDELFTDTYEGPMDGTYLRARPQILGLHRSIPPIDPRDRDHLDGLYQGEVRFVDDQIGRLLEAIEASASLEESLIVVFGDHGEEIGDHGSLEGHGWTLYEEVLRVPLVFRFPGGLHRGTVVDQPVGLMDVAPTILDFLEIDTPDGFQGRSLLPLLDPAIGPSSFPPVVSDSGGRLGVFKRSVRGPRFKLIESKDTGQWQVGPPFGAGYELYDLQSDPHETTNLYRPDHPEASRLLRVLEALDLQQARVGEATTEEVELSEEERRMLESLGYIQ